MCEHDWKFQDDYSKPGGIKRWKCAKCGIWGWSSCPNHWDGYQPRPIRAYKGDRTEPESTWHRRWRKPLPPAKVPHGEYQYTVDSRPSRMEQAVLGADRFIDPGEC
jgi:hypothetical protein